MTQNSQIATQASVEAPHDCQENDLQPVEHEENATDWKSGNSAQGYQVKRCRVCGDYWGIRYQWDAGTGSDDHDMRFGPDPSTVHRHY